MRRPVWLGAGVALGVGGTLWAQQRVRRGVRKAVDRLTPEHVAAGARESVRDLGARVRAAVETAQEVKVSREAELWEELGARGRPAAAPAARSGPAGQGVAGAEVQRSARAGR